MPQFGQSRGFTLVETLVALVVLALALGVVYETLGWTLRRTKVLGKQELAMSVAQSVIAGLRASESIESRTRKGEEAGMHWKYVAEPLERSHGEDAPVPVAVVVDVAWGARRTQQLSLQTVLLTRSIP